MDEYLTDATFRDPSNFELKTFHSLATIDDVWLWHYYVLAPKVYTSQHYNGAQQEGKDRGTILTFNRLTTGFRMVNANICTRRVIECSCESAPASSSAKIYIWNFLGRAKGLAFRVEG